MSNTIFDMQLQDTFSGATITTAGGKVLVCNPGTTRKATLLNPDAGMAPLANPMTPNRGKIRFAISNVVGAAPGTATVDLYGISPAGHFFVVYGEQPGNEAEIYVSSNNRQEILIVPYAVLDTAAGVETDTGFDFPANCLIQPPPLVTVKTPQAGGTLNVGLLSTQAGGNASGFVAGVSIATAGAVKSTLAGAGTLGALLKVASGGATVPEDALITTATRLTYTVSTGAVADGFLCIPYQLTH